ncbi:PAS domain S-box-containing protein [Natronincola peptidivorans]|uniref:histidine kinase n=1 Tax=Natronincola peptidivorans TaxID=426128 RepID=A0A1I0FBH5_9FIRM|nr:ATP-binding protein [Natronincola peptidivorans]SET54529.1 PAS domain S-box-containing protein [Natronincola peptidivorans]
MKKASKLCMAFYALMIFLNLLPLIPTSLKGIMGLFFITISAVRIGYRDGLITATLWIVLGYINVVFNINVDYRYTMTNMFLGTGLYFFIAHYLGKTTEELKKKNVQLKNEIKTGEKIQTDLKNKVTVIQSLMDTIPSPIFFKDLDCLYIGCNQAYEEAIGVKEKDIIGKSPYDIYDVELADIYNKIDHELLANADVQKLVYETVVTYADGSVRNIILNKGIFTDERGKPMGIVGVFTDITDKKEIEILKQDVVEKKRIIDEILEQEKIKTEFFSNISHELRTPLNVLLGSIQLLERYSEDDIYGSSQGKVMRNVSIMKQNGYRMLRLVNNLIDITKMDASAFEIHLRNYDVVSIVEEIALSVSSYMESKGLQLVFDTEVEEKIIACDEEKIERIMLNLLSNAVKFTPTGGTVFVGIYQQEDSLLIKVEDDGIGIPSEKQEEIFKRFCQIKDLFSRQHEGSGIGLNIVKALVEMHEGTISVESQINKGTTFTIQLPIKTVEEEAAACKSLSKQDLVEKISVEFSDIYTTSSLSIENKALEKYID